MTSGIPQVVHPFFGDQPFWANRLRALGVATAPLHALVAHRLASALEDAMELRPAAQRIKHPITDEDGIANALTRLEHAVRC